MTTTLSVFLLVMATSQARVAGEIQKPEIEQQKEVFKTWWGRDLTTKLTELPTDGKVPDYRVPYSGHDYPDKAGGTIQALVKYDQAYNRGRSSAVEFERKDVTVHRGGRASAPESGGRRPLFSGLFRPRVPGWYGHCNGWTAAAIRHAEPEHSVVRNGVTFTPSDIKGLLAEMYMYSPTEFLGGIDDAVNPGTFHLTLTNWLGLGAHPVGMESALGEVVINFPIFSYKSTVKPLSDRQHEVQMTITYTVHVMGREVDKGPKNHKTMYFHYSLNTDADGNVIGGRYYGDSGRVDMLWTPLQPVQGGEEANKRGNPHMDIQEVLAIWRESVSEETRKKWLNIDPTEEDRVTLPGEAAVAAKSEEAKPAEAKPTEEKPADAKPAEAKPVVEAKPAVEGKPAADAKPAEEAKPAAEAKPEAKPAEPKPSDAR